MLGAPQKTFIAKVANIARKELELRTAIEEANTLYNGSPNWDEAITQTDIDADPVLLSAGLTTQMIADVIYSAKIADDSIYGNLPAFFILANIVY